MTTLLLGDKAADDITQTFTTTERFILTNVRPLLYFAQIPNATYTINVKDGATTLATKSLTQAEIIAGSDITAINYAYGFINFALDSPIFMGISTYTLELVTSGYSPASSSFVGWVIEHEDLTNALSGTPANDLENPYSFQLWGYKEMSTSFRQIEFIDGFTSASQPNTDGLVVTQSNQTIANNTTADLTDALFDFNTVVAATIDYKLSRSDDTPTDVDQTGKLRVLYDGSAWSITQTSLVGDDVGVTFSITAGGQVEYTSSNFTGASYAGNISYKTSSISA